MITIDNIPGGSLRTFLKSQGVTDETSLRKHIQFILDTEERTNCRLDISRYRVNPNNPNEFPPVMG